MTIIENKKKKIYGIQFHPEVTHTKNGDIIFKNFIFEICKVKKQLKLKSEKNRIINEIKDTVKKEQSKAKVNSKIRKYFCLDSKKTSERIYGYFTKRSII